MRAAIAALIAGLLIAGGAVVTAPPAAAAATFIVDSTGDGVDANTADGICADASGSCTLRAAVQLSNATLVADAIHFAIPGAGAHRIVPAGRYRITQPVLIDGTTQPGYAGAPLIEIDGNGLASEGFYLTGGSSTIRGLAIGGFGKTGVFLDGDDNILEGNRIGTDALGAAALPNGEGGVLVRGTRNRIGGAAPGAGNLISGNIARGILLNSAYDTVIQGNFIGTDASGTHAIGNGPAHLGGYGIESQWAFRGQIGGTAPGAGNLISGNTNKAINIWLATSRRTENIVQGNLIGTDVTGTLPLGNGAGVAITIASGNLVGGTEPDAGNVIAFNRSGGIGIGGQGGCDSTYGACANTILGNSIHENGFLAIGLASGGAGPTQNDPGDADLGTNELQNFPVITSVSSSGGSTTIDGSLDSEPSQAYRLEFFANTACDPSGHGEGERFLGSQDVVPEASGVVGFSVVLPVTLGSGEVVTSTATDPAGNTSEFSECRAAPLEVDPTPPIVTGVPDRPPNAAGWYNADVLVDWQAFDRDPSSGTPTDPPDTLATTEGANVLYTSNPSCDPAGNCATGQIQLSIDKTAPTVGTPTFSVNPKAVTETSTLSTTATDILSGVTNGEYFIGADPGAGNDTPMTLSGGTLSATIGTDLTPGVHQVGLRAKDGADNWSAANLAYLVVYDPSAGFATGGGWIVPGGNTSDPGDLLPGLDGTSKANFGFVVKYQNGTSTVPSGNLDFHYNVSNFHLRSAAMDWLVVTNTQWAKFQGMAHIDGTTDLYPFRVDARDDNNQGDRFVIKIWAPDANTDTDEPIYKASGNVQDGQIKIHK